MLKRIKRFLRKSAGLMIVHRNSVLRSGWHTTKYLDAYATSLYVHACVEKRAEKVGQIQFTLHRGETEITSHAILDLLYRPNPFHDKAEFFALYQTYKDLAGSAYIYLMRTAPGAFPTELHLLRPDWVRVEYSTETGLIANYKYKRGGVDEIDISPDDVIASHYPSPLDQLGGLSKLAAASKSIDTESQLADYQYNVLKNGGKVEGVISYEADDLDQEQIDEIKEQYDRHYAEAKNSGKPLILYGGAKYENHGLTPTELSFIESKRLTRDDILLAFGVPKVIVAQTDDVNLANAKVGKEVFLSETIKPLLMSLSETLDERLVPPEFALGFVDPTPEDVELKLKQIDNGIKNYYMTPNEARSLCGLDPIDGGDSLFVPFSMMPLDAHVVREPDEKAVKSEWKHPLLDKEARERYAKVYLKQSEQRERTFGRAIRSYWKSQLGRLISQLDTEIKGKSVIDEIFNLDEEIKLGLDVVLPLIEGIMRDAGEDARVLVGSDKPFEMTQQMRSTLHMRAEFFMDVMSKRTFKDLTSAFAASVEAGEDRKALMKRIEGVYDGYSKGRLQTVARTEVQTATQTAKQEAYKQAGVKTKIWVAVGDARTRESHFMVDGQERGWDRPFSNGLMFPNEHGAPAEETINCRCTI